MAGSVLGGDALKAMLGETAVLDRSDAMCSAFTEDWRGATAATGDLRRPAGEHRAGRRDGQALRGGRRARPGPGRQHQPVRRRGAGRRRRPPVIVNLQRMRRIRSVDPANNAICVDAGCVLAAVQQAAVENGRLYPVSLGAEGSCQIGGTIATNAGGTGVLRYGNMRDNVLGLEVVLPDGSVWDGLYALRKNNTGYDLKHLFIGSEGTLGIVTGAVLKLHPLPTARSVAWLGVASPAGRARRSRPVSASCDARLSAFELMDENQVALVVKHVSGPALPADRRLGLACAGRALRHERQRGAGRGDAGRAGARVRRGLIGDAVVATSEAQRAAMWEFRHSVSEANKKGGVGLTTDCAVPVSAVPAFIETATEAVARHRAGPADGRRRASRRRQRAFHSVLQLRAVGGDRRQGRFAQQIRRAVNDAAVALGGTFSAEHGVGQTLSTKWRATSRRSRSP